MEGFVFNYYFLYIQFIILKCAGNLFNILKYTTVEGYEKENMYICVCACVPVYV